MSTLVFVGRYLTQSFIDQLNANFAAGGGGGGGLITVPSGGTGLTSLTAHGVIIGQGAGAVTVTGPGTIGQVFTSNGPSTDPSFQPASGASLYPPLPAPDLQTFLQAAATNNVFAEWIWGNVTVAAPIVVTVNDSRNDIGVDFHGANIIPGYGDVTKDVITYSLPATSTIFAQISGLQIRNVTIFGINTVGARINNGITVSCPSHNNGIFGVQINNCALHACGNSGLLFYGAVFEADIFGHYGRDNTFAAIELRNPPQGSGGVISSVNLWGGDLRTNRYGLAMTADVTFQEPSGVHVFATNFIANNDAAVFATSGLVQIDGCHFENNCASNGGSTNGAITIVGGQSINISQCDAVHSTGNGQTFLLQMAGGGGSFVTIYRSYSFNENTFAGEFTASLTGNGTLYASADQPITSFSGPGAGWVINIPAFTTVTI